MYEGKTVTLQNSGFFLDYNSVQIAEEIMQLNELGSPITELKEQISSTWRRL